jgi:hypothetical protein
VNRDPFLRLALLVCASVWIAALAFLQERLGWWWFAAVLVGSIAQVVLLTYEPSPKKPGTDRRRRFRQPAEGTRGFERIE